MSLSDGLLPEFDHEMANTRRTLQRVPDDKFDWKPHDKSMAMGQLVSHLAALPSWGVFTIKQDSLDVAPADGPKYQERALRTTEEVLSEFDRNVAELRAAIASTSDDFWMKTWSLLARGNAIFTMPKVAVLRSFILSHNIHHRAQLGVYLRMNDVPVPAIYGPSADEQGMPSA